MAPVWILNAVIKEFKVRRSLTSPPPRGGLSRYQGYGKLPGVFSPSFLLGKLSKVFSGPNQVVPLPGFQSSFSAPSEEVKEVFRAPSRVIFSPLYSSSIKFRLQFSFGNILV